MIIINFTSDIISLLSWTEDRRRMTAVASILEFTFFYGHLESLLLEKQKHILAFISDCSC
jgi:hypothetical protein